MDAETWFDCYARMSKAFGKPMDAEQRQVYFDALREMPGPTIRLAVHQAIKDAKHMPNVATLREYCTAASREVAAPASLRCEACHGDGLVDADPIHENGVIYRNVARPCRACRATQAGE